jgi:hypothetical protein
MRRLMEGSRASGYWTGTVWLMEEDEVIRIRKELTVRSKGKRKGGK